MIRFKSVTFGISRLSILLAAMVCCLPIGGFAFGTSNLSIHRTLPCIDPPGLSAWLTPTPHLPASASGVNASDPSRNQRPAPRFFTVIVGISDYEGSLVDLTYCDDDASLFMSYLNRAFPREMSAGKSVLLLNHQATKDNIIRAIQEVFAQSTENDYIMLFFSGHGSTGYFVPADHSSAQLSHSEIKRLFSQAQARYRVCIADACFSGSIASAPGSSQIEASTSELRDARIAVIMSSRPSQISRESGALKQGVFTHYLIKGLTGPGDANGDGYIMVGELFQYVKRTVAQTTQNDQVPVIYGKNLHLIPMARVKK